VRKKGIFCIEGLWDNDLRRQSTVRPILELLHTREEIQYIYRDCATVEELEFYARQWTLKRYRAFPILYLAFHGERNAIFIGSKPYSLDDIGALFEGRCRNAIIVFGSCSTLDMRRSRLSKFLEKTQALAVCGYRSDVDWLTATAFELLMLSAMQDNEFSGRGIDAIEKKIRRFSGLVRDLRFHMVNKFSG
jgi:hypothetical protein